MDVQPLENKALSWGTIRKAVCRLAEITIRKSQLFALARLPRASAARALGPSCPGARRLNRRSGWPRASRGRAANLVHSRLSNRADAAQWMAGAARLAHV